MHFFVLWDYGYYAFCFCHYCLSYGVVQCDLFHFSSFGILVFFVMVILVQFLYFYFKESISKDRRPPIAGLVLNELVHFDKIFDYQMTLARKHGT